MKELKEGGSYKDLEVIQANVTMHHGMKEKVKTDYRDNRNKYMSNFISKILYYLSRLGRDRIRANR